MYLEHRLSALLQLNLNPGLNAWFQWIGQRQLQDETRIVYVLGFGASYIRDFTVRQSSPICGQQSEKSNPQFPLSSATAYDITPCTSFIFPLFLWSPLRVRLRIHIVNLDLGKTWCIEGYMVVWLYGCRPDTREAFAIDDARSIPLLCT